MIEVTREPTENKLLGESYATVSVDGNSTSTPTPAITQTDIARAETMFREYGVSIAYKNEVLDVNSFYSKKAFGNIRVGNLDDQIDYVDDWIKKSQAKVAFFSPTFGSEVVNRPKIIEFVRMVSAGSAVNAITVVEAPTAQGTATVLDETKAALKKEGINKSLLLYVDIGQDTEEFAAKCALAKKEGNGVIAKYANPKEWFDNITTLARYKEDSRFLRVLVGMQKTYPRFGKAALLPHGAVVADIFARARGFGIIPDEDKKQKTLTEAELNKRALTNAIRHIWRNNGYFNRADLEGANMDNLDCAPICPVDARVENSRDDFYVEYEDFLPEASAVHDAFSIHAETWRIREQIKMGKLREFLNRKPYSRKIMEEVFRNSLGNQRKITNG